MKKKPSISILLCLLLVSLGSTSASEEGTRHITGSQMDLYFMNDKVFGTAGGHPLWAIYNCGTDINGEIDIKGTYRKFTYAYHKEGQRLITGTFGPLEMAMGKIQKTTTGFVYQVFVGGKEHRFSIRYEKLEDEHMVNSIIEGTVGEGSSIKLKVDGRLCPFATTGIIMIAIGAATLAG